MVALSWMMSYSQAHINNFSANPAAEKILTGRFTRHSDSAETQRVFLAVN
jgi:hypothetical protein